MEAVEKNEAFNIEENLLAPYRHLVRAQKKPLGSNIFSSFNHWFKVPEDNFLRVKTSVNLFLNAITLIDDIQDNSLIRRGSPTAHCVYGTPLTINAGLQLIAESMRNISDIIPNGLACKIFADEFREIMVGQGTEIYWRDNNVCPTEEQYKKMIQQKTGGSIKIGVKLLQLLSNHNKNYDNLVQLLGYYYQLQDDYCNLCAKELNQEGIFCEDITEGKFTLPIIHASKTPAALEIFSILLFWDKCPDCEMVAKTAKNYVETVFNNKRSILQNRTSDEKLKKYCLSLLEQTGSLEYTRDKLNEVDREARAELERLGGNPHMEVVLTDLNCWRENRMYLLEGL